MERAGRVIGKLSGKSGMSRHGLTDEQLALAAWPVAVGERLALRTAPIAVVRDRLVIQVEDAVWQRQLFALRSQILDQLENVAGRRVVEQLEFRVAVPTRQPPARAESLGAPADEADGIKDVYLRDIYKAARKKASA
jgi:hypothetical protein